MSRLHSKNAIPGDHGSYVVSVRNRGVVIMIMNYGYQRFGEMTPLLSRIENSGYALEHTFDGYEED